MSKNRPVRLGRTFLLELGPNEDILQSVEAAVAEHGIKSAVFLSGIGDLDCCNSHYAAKDENGKYMDYPLQWKHVPLTLSGVQGFIEKGRCHLHGVIGNDQELSLIHISEPTRP